MLLVEPLNDSLKIPERTKSMNDIECLAALKRIYIETLNLRKNHVDLTKNFCLLSELENEYEELYGKIAKNAPENLILKHSEFPLKENEMLCIPAHLHEGYELREKQTLHELLKKSPKRWIQCSETGVYWYLNQERICEELWR